MNLPFLTFLSLVRPARALQAELVQLITSLPESRMPKGRKGYIQGFVRGAKATSSHA